MPHPSMPDTESAPLGAVEQVDVLIVGAGLSGIGVGCYLTRTLPQKSFVILGPVPVPRHPLGLRPHDVRV